MGEVVEFRRGVPERRLRKREVAERLGVSTRTVENYMRQGLPFEKPGGPQGMVWFRWRVVEAWLAGRDTAA
jgi:phage terminase Nu1 subunit (DNA packaging protein)